MQHSSSRSIKKTDVAVVGGKWLGWVAQWFRRDSSDGATSYLALSSKTDLKRLEAALGYRMRDKTLFIQAVLHRSYLQFLGNTSLQSNERLEFLGDSILSLVVAEYLFTEYPKAEEGELTVFRSRLVNRKALVHFAHEINLRDFLITSNSAAQAVDKGSETVIADAFEAILAALYLDGGIAPARELILRQLKKAVAEGLLLVPNENYKSTLLEYGQANGHGIPRYVIAGENGPDHDRTFTAEVYFGSSLIGSGSGKNKKEAEQAAAAQAMAHIER
jgi:ribonuclease III